MQSLSRWVLSHKAVVVVFWVILALIGMATAKRSVDALSFQITVPGKPGFETNQSILRIYGNGGNTPPIVAVITLPPGVRASEPRVERRIGAAFARVSTSLHGARVVSYATTRNHAFLSADGRTTFGLIYASGPPGFGTPGLSTVHRVFSRVAIDGARFSISGTGPLSAGSSSGGLGTLGEVLLGGVGALLVLAFVFGSALAVVPLVMAAVAIPVTFLLIWGLTAITDISFIVQYLIGILGLGVGIDYSLLLVTRWREERQGGLANDDAVRRAMETAGVSVVFSGVAVAIGLIALVILPLPFLRSVGFAGMLIPLVSVAAALTLLPVVLATVGPRFDKRAFGHRRQTGGFWFAWARGVVAHPRIAAAAALLLLGALVFAVTSISIGAPKSVSLAGSGDAHTGLTALQRSGVGAGALTPFEVLVRGGDPQGVARRLDAVPGVRAAVAPDSTSWRRSGTAIVEVFPVADGNSSAGHDTLGRVRSVAQTLPGVGVGGEPAQDVDFVSATYGSFPLAILLIAVLTFVALVRAFRSVVLALKAVVLNVVSVAAAWGVMVLIWQYGFGSKLIWGIQSTGSIESWVPIAVFAFLFGLSMDYEVFLLTRMREAYDVEGTTEGSVIAGTGHTGKLITSAALILFLAFVSLASAPITDIKVLGTGLGAGILLDATVVRMLLVPALMKLFGDWNWWLPAWMGRLLRVPRGSHNANRLEEVAS